MFHQCSGWVHLCLTVACSFSFCVTLFLSAPLHRYCYICGFFHDNAFIFVCWECVCFSFCFSSFWNYSQDLGLTRQTHLIYFILKCPHSFEEQGQIPKLCWVVEHFRVCIWGSEFHPSHGGGGDYTKNKDSLTTTTSFLTLTLLLPT